MYEHQGLQEVFFVMLYGGASMMALLAALYLLLRRTNVVSPGVNSPRELRCWAAAFLFSVAASHVWWYVLGIHWLEDDRFLRNAIAITLDRITFVPIMMCVLLRMLQHRRLPLWPIVAAMVPFVVIAVLSIVQHNHRFELYMESYSLLLCVVFFIIYVREVWCYGRWLRDNYADLEHKEVWQSLVLIACILLVYIVYTTNEGALGTEYLAQWLTLAIILFIVWRVDTLERLVGEQVKVVPIVDGAVSEQAEDAVDDVVDTGADVAMLLQTRCETTLLYVQHDLTLSQLAAEIGTSRATLNAWLSEQGDTYHAYINRLRIDHFIDIYRESLSVEHPYTIYELVTHCGYSSYATFSTAFRKRTGLTLAQWMKKENLAKKSTHHAYNRYESR